MGMDDQTANRFWSKSNIVKMMRVELQKTALAPHKIHELDIIEDPHGAAI
jgi:hypothetical protein